MSSTERSRDEIEGEHPEVDRSYDRERGGQVPEEQSERDEPYKGPDPEHDGAGESADEDQGI